jgi:molybdate transport system ATP-binding protein
VSPEDVARPWALRCEAARIDQSGGTLIDALSCAAQGPRLGLVGLWSGLFRLLAAQATLASGSVFVADQPAATAVRDGRAGVALADAPMPARWTALEYLRASARLAGLGRGDSRHAASRALESIGLAALGARRIAELAVPERRALAIAHAALGDPVLIALESPLAGLDERTAQWLGELSIAASRGRLLIVSATALGPASAERSLFDRLDELIVLEGGAVVAQGPPAHALAPADRWFVTVVRQAALLAEKLAERGATVHVTRPGGALELSSGTAEIGEAARLLVELPAGQGSALIVEVADDIAAPLLELVPH